MWAATFSNELGGSIANVHFFSYQLAQTEQNEARHLQGRTGRDSVDMCCLHFSVAFSVATLKASIGQKSQGQSQVFMYMNARLSMTVPLCT